MRTRSDSFRLPRAGARPARRAILLGLALLVAACSGRSPRSGTFELPPACDAFVAKYESCLRAAVPSLPSVAKDRAAQTRASLQEEAQRAAEAAAATSTASNLTNLATKCSENLQRLTATCGAARTN